jgi:cell division protein FtsW
MNRALRLYDPGLFWLAILATLVGLLFIFDAGYARSLANNRGILPTEFVMQGVFMIPALIVYWVCGSIRASTYQKLAGPLWFVALLALAAVDIFGHEQNNAKRWIDIGPVSVQPSEFAKLAAVVYLAAVFANRKAWPAKIKRYKDLAQRIDFVWMPKFKRCLPGLYVLLGVLFIEHGKDLGTGAVVATIAAAMFFIGGVSRKTLIVGGLITAVGVGGMIVKQPYRMERITNHTQRWDADKVDSTGYQTAQSELGIATGGLIGVGLGNGRAKHLIPAPTTDFIMATIGEETGLLGSMLVIGIIGAVVWRLMWLAARSQDRFAMLVLNGVAAWFGIQCCVNVMMANGFLPAIGIPIPFISSGGSSLIALWMAVGVCQAVVAPAPAKEEAHATRRNRWGHRRARLSRA